MPTYNVRLVADHLKDLLQKPEQVFLLIAAVFGIIMVFVMPLFMVPDETVHFDRAYQVGGGHLTSQTVKNQTGGVVPVVPGVRYINGMYVPPIPRHQYFARLSPSDKKFVPFPSSALYSPVAYIPQAIGVDVGRVIHPSLGAMVFAGRIFNLAAYLALVWLAIKIAKQGKWVYAMAGLFPVAIQEAASLSTDVMTIGLAFVTIALLHGLFYQEKPISRRQFLAIALLAIGLGLTKQTNVIFLAPILFMPKRLFVTVLRKVWLVAGAIVLCIGAAFLWFIIIKYHHYQIANLYTTNGMNNVNEAGQLKYVLTHPFSFVKTVFKTFVFQGFKGIALPDFFWVSMYGYFSLFTYSLPIPFISLGYAVLLIAYLYSSHTGLKDRFLVKLTFIQTAVFIVSAVAIAGALYLVWTPVGAAQVAGIQGRYFIPLIPLLIPLFALLSRWVKVTLDKPYRMGMLVAAASIINLAAMTVLTYKYFP